MKKLHLIILITLFNFLFMHGLLYFANMSAAENGRTKTVKSLLVQDEKEFEQENISPTATITAQDKVVKTDNVLVAPTQSLSVQPTSSQPMFDTRCIVSVNSQRYDVTQFRQIHGGGDIFACGTDMTSVFYSQHNDTILDKMQLYKI